MSWYHALGASLGAMHQELLLAPCIGSTSCCHASGAPLGAMHHEHLLHYALGAPLDAILEQLMMPCIGSTSWRHALGAPLGIMHWEHLLALCIRADPKSPTLRSHSFQHFSFSVPIKKNVTNKHDSLGHQQSGSSTRGYDGKIRARISTRIFQHF